MPNKPRHSGRQLGRIEVRPPAEPAVLEREVPMCRYVNLLPVRGYDRHCGCCSGKNELEEEKVLLEQILEVLTGQNQILVDIQGAISALTAAILSHPVRV